VIVHVYGGPLPPDSSGEVIASMQAWLLPQWIADQGFVVVESRRPRHAGPGPRLERAIFKQIGAVPLADQLAGLKALGQKYRELDLIEWGSSAGHLAATFRPWR